MERVVHIIDDDELWRAVLVEMLTKMGDLEVIEWESGDAFHEATGKQPGIALIDVRMPGMSGTELLRQMDQARFLAIMMSGNAEIELAVEAVKRGAFDFLEKPCSIERLAQTIAAGFETFRIRYQREMERAEVFAKFQGLSDREREVTREIVAGSTNREAGDKFGISVRTVEAHRARIMLKLGLPSFADVVRKAHECGFAKSRGET
ncbi:response regulator transcription factor [Alteriqipengyuania sp.]|uniref:response regulator transcription factor n=1 Tax=Alteriqipengyuania sp. TaxID=2800692 RepID=UPI003513A4D0